MLVRCCFLLAVPLRLLLFVINHLILSVSLSFLIFFLSLPSVTEWLPGLGGLGKIEEDPKRSDEMKTFSFLCLFFF